MDNDTSCRDISRRDFLRALAASVGAALVGTAGCQPGGDTVESGPSPSTPELAATQNPDGTLTVSGGGQLTPGTALTFAMPPDNAPGIVFVTSKGTLGALSAKCTHAGCIVKWQAQDKETLLCPCHGSRFDSKGQVLKGPAKTPLAAYKVRKHGDNAIITINT